MGNWAQYSGVLDRLALIGLTYVASKGWITPADAAGLSTMIVGIIGAIYAFYINRASNLTVRAAAASPENVIIASPELAKSTPYQPNIVSHDEVKVVSK